MAMIKNVQKLHEAVAKVAPIDGVSGDGEIWFQKQATDKQKKAAVKAVEAFVDSEPDVRVPVIENVPLPAPKSIFEA
jgi:hypothetical protein